MKRFWLAALSVLSGGVWGLAGSAPGQASPSDSVIILYEDANHLARGVRFTTAVSDLSSFRFDRRASSVRIEGGGWWEVCTGSDYRGECRAINHSLRNFSAWGFDDRIVSLRPLPNQTAASARGGLILYSEPGHRGRSVTILDTVEDLSALGFNDTARSLQVVSGDWVVCRHNSFASDCHRVSADVTDLRDYGLDRSITAIAPWRTYQDRLRHDPRGRDARDFYYSAGDIRGGVRGVDTLFLPRPEVGGHRIHYCLDERRRRCGQAAADALCRDLGFRRAVYWDYERARAGAWYWGDGRAASGYGDALIDVLCARY